MKQIHKRRLLKLADLLIADARKKKGVKFTLATWVSPSDPSTGIACRFAGKPREIPVSCETYACAVGLACISGTFKRSGLTFTYDGNHDAGYRVIPKYGRKRSWGAVQAFFGINLSTADRLFTAVEYDGYTGAKAERAVAKRIRDLVKGKDIFAPA